MADVDVTTFTFETDDGVILEGDVLTPESPLGVAIVCHPHPLHGGTRRDAVVAGLCRGLVDAAATVLRFDFRGAGGSSGTHGGGEPERDDLVAAIDAVADDDLPLTVAGYSFGADIALSVDHRRVTGWLVVAPPLLVLAADRFVAGTDPRPVRIVVGGSDEIAPPARITAATQEWDATDETIVDGADHFFSGAMGTLAEIAAETAVSHRPV